MRYRGRGRIWEKILGQNLGRCGLGSQTKLWGAAGAGSSFRSKFWSAAGARASTRSRFWGASSRTGS